MNVGHKLMLIVISSVALVTIPSAIAIYYYTQHKMLTTEATTLVAETKLLSVSHTQKLADAKRSLNALARIYEKDLAKTINAGDEMAFDHLVQHDSDLAWRNVSTNFNGRVESGLFVPPNALLDGEQKKNYLRSKQILDVFGGSIQSLFNNVWLLSRDNSLNIYDAGVPDFVTKMPIDIDYTKTPWITLGDPIANPSREMRWTPTLYDPIVKTWLVSAVQPLDINGKWIGMLGHDVYLNKMLPTLFQPSQRYKSEQHFLLDTKGNFIEAGVWQQALEAKPESFKPDLSNEPDLAQLLASKLSPEPKAFQHKLSFQGQDYLAVGMTLPDVNWRYFRLVPTNEILAPMRKLFYALVAMVLASGLLIGFLIDAAVKRNIVQRLQQLASAVRSYGLGDLNARASLTGDDEIAKTSHEFDAMANQLKATLDAIPDLLFEFDLGGRYIAVHLPLDNSVLTSEDELVGKTLQQVLPPESAAIVMAALQEANEKGWCHGKQYQRETNKGLTWFELSVAKKATKNNESPRFIVLSRNITERKSAESEIQQLAFYDTLTALPNRRLLLDRLRHALDSSARSGNDGALLFLDLDHFKTINDTLGHDTGDLLLKQVAERLAVCIRKDDTVARLGGDEYVIVLANLSAQPLESATQVASIAEKILASLNQPYQLTSGTYHSTASIGVSLFSDHNLSQDELLKHADIAMYQAKKAGRNTIRFFDPNMQNAINAKAAMESELRTALKKQQFQLHYQVQVDDSGRPFGAEALIRWHHPQRGLITPVHFIPMAEETGLILAIGDWVLETACAQIKLWQQDSAHNNLALSVNVSAKQFRQKNFVSQVKAAVRHHSVNPALLKLELTESMLLEDVEDTVATMNALKEIGVQFSLDDFGTGYSSLQYLKRLPLNQLKIDQSFVRDIAIDSSDQAIVKTIIAMAQTLNLQVIAEGVETEEQRQLLIDNGCTNFQGYLFGKPMPNEQFESALEILKVPS